ncbi:MAG: D-alanyl-D-alanine carboxypeptidase [Bacteroidaceae bacterium]|nr:D-alanyl-D-alanine carboxypeptidase [Bacteroidaceae bacterium]
MIYSKPKTILLLLLASVSVLAVMALGVYSTDCILNKKKESLKPHIPTDIGLACTLDSIINNQTALDPEKMGIAIYDLTADTLLYSLNNDTPYVPASTVKILTAMMAFHNWNTDHKFRSKLLIDSTRFIGDHLNGNLILDLAADPAFPEAELFADSIKRLGINSIQGKLKYRLAVTDTLTADITTLPRDFPYYRRPLLFRGEKHVKEAFHNAFRKAGISIEGDTIDDNPTTTLIAYQSPLRSIIAHMLTFSSNRLAEAIQYNLARELAQKHGSHINKHNVNAWYIDSILKYNGKDKETVIIYDGSGLSPSNQLTPHFLTWLLREAWKDKTLRDNLIHESLATPNHPGRRGSVRRRMHDPRFTGKVFCKTGTMPSHGITTLCGYIHSDSGHWYAFTILNNDSPQQDSRDLQDAICLRVIDRPRMK